MVDVRRGMGGPRGRQWAPAAVCWLSCISLSSTPGVTSPLSHSLPRPRPGHTSWSTSGLGYLTFWLMGHLRAFDGSAQPQRFIASLVPLLGAVWIGLSRIQDYWCV